MLALLIEGNERGVVKLMESVLRSGNDLYFVYLDVLVPAMNAIGMKWSAGEIDVFIEHRASGIASRSAALIGARFSKRGVRKGTVLIGSPTGETAWLAPFRKSRTSLACTTHPCPFLVAGR
jgi:methanogenic corrinoid protein MtbC1